MFLTEKKRHEIRLEIYDCIDKLEFRTKEALKEQRETVDRWKADIERLQKELFYFKTSMENKFDGMESRLSSEQRWKIAQAECISRGMVMVRCEAYAEAKKNDGSVKPLSESPRP